MILPWVPSMTTSPIYPVVWQAPKVLLIDQTQLPEKYVLVEVGRSGDMAEAIRTMIVRGAPAIGVAAAYGMYLGSQEIATADRPQLLTHLEAVAQLLRSTRPTAVNLFWAIGKMMHTAYETLGGVEAIREALLATAHQIREDDLATCQAIGDHGVTALPAHKEKLTILTHCNAGSLATAGYGTALGVIRSAWRDGRLARVFADETRPRLQGAKLTAWECVQEGIPVTVISDNMAAHCMKQGKIDAVVVGADRIARNGDAANKIGTYGLAVIAQAHGLPFYVAAPLSTVDFALEQGDLIPIEERDPQEIYQVGMTRLCAPGAEFYNPAFDVTPARLITAIITERGAIAPGDLYRLQP